MNGVFKVGLSGMMAAQRGLSTTAHNISNVGTPGYSRQSPEFATRAATGAGDGFIGNGVDTSTVRRIVDDFVSLELRAATSNLARATTFSTLSSELDNAVGAAAGAVDPALNRFFSSLQDLAANPGSVVVRELVLSDARTLAQRFEALDARLDSIRSSADNVLRASVSEVNRLAGAIAEINQDITRNQGRYRAQPANDLLDQRDELVRQLAQHIDVHTYLQDNGALNVSVASGQSLVTGTIASELSVSASAFDPAQAEVSIMTGSVSSVITSHVTGGAIGGAIAFRDGILGSAQNHLGQLALGVSAGVNERHALGQDLNGMLGGDLFSSLFDTPRTFAHALNSGTASLDARVKSVSPLTNSDYLLARSGTSYSLTRLADGAVTALDAFPSDSQTVDGVVFSLAAGTMADGDQFLIQPTRIAAGEFALNQSVTASDVAAALPVRIASNGANTGTAKASVAINAPSNDLRIEFNAGGSTYDVVDVTTGAALEIGASYVSGAAVLVNGLSLSITGAPAAGDVFYVNDLIGSSAPNVGTGALDPVLPGTRDPNLADVVTITFDTANTFSVTGATNGGPTANVPFASGQPISFNGWTVNFQGSPSAGDIFTIEPNVGATGDNRNALSLASLARENTLSMDSAHYSDLYGSMVGSVAVSASRAQTDVSAREALVNQLQDERDSISAVNLDEEAAKLLRFQQSYQASAEVIAIANETFDSLLAVFSR